ncbi:MAG: diacylglycerol kinase family protein [Nannocystaceae bacterium]
MPESRITILVANPTARSGRAQRAIDQATQGLARAGLSPEFLATLPKGATVEALARRLAEEDVARVVYLGGDGTFAESAKGIILARERSGVDVPLGMLPMGTANDQGRSFGIMSGERALETNIAIVARGVEQWLDAGRIRGLDEGGDVVQEDLWFDSFGFGLSALILAQRNRDRVWVGTVPFLNRVYRDKLVYAGASVHRFFRTMFGKWRFACEIRVDGVLHQYSGCTDVIVKGTILYGGDWIFAPAAKPDDGVFEVVVLASHADWVSATISAHKHNPVTDDDLAALGVRRREVLSGKDIDIRLRREEESRLPAQIDGEEFASCDHYQVDNLFRHLRVIVPEGAHWV